MLGVFEKVRRGVGKCVGVWGEVRGVRGDVGGRCGRMCGEVCLGVGEVKEVCWGVWGYSEEMINTSSHLSLSTLT